MSIESGIWGTDCTKTEWNINFVPLSQYYYGLLDCDTTQLGIGYPDE
jgi:hypothetical protein